MKFFFILIATSLIFSASAKTSFDFAEDLIEQGDLFRALTIYKEIEFQNRYQDTGFKAQKNILRIHSDAEDYENFDIQVERLIKIYKKNLNDTNPTLLRAEASFLMKHYSKAFELIQKTSAPIENKYLFKAYSESKKELPPCTSDVCKQIKEIETDSSKLHLKNENLALALGIIPGLGQIYAGKTSSGISSFILNSFFATISIMAFNNNEKAMGYASAIVGSTFYFSSIYAGYETAKRYNSSLKINEQKKLNSVPIKLEIINFMF